MLLITCLTKQPFLVEIVLQEVKAPIDVYPDKSDQLKVK